MKLDPTMLPFDPSPYQENVIPYVIVGVLLVAIACLVEPFLPDTGWTAFVTGVTLVGGIAMVIGSGVIHVRTHANLYAAAKEHFHIVNQGASANNSFRLPGSVGSTVTLRGYTLRDDDGSYIIRDLVLEKQQDGTYTMSYVVNEESGA